MDVALLARLQFALVISFHYIFPPISMGLGLILVILQSFYMKTNKTVYYQMLRFGVWIFAIVFGFGALTGFMLEHEMGTQWAAYSHFIQHVFGDMLAKEAVVSFFLESSLVLLLIFGLERIKKTYYLVITILATLIPHLNAVWIVMLNSWQQTPIGYKLVGSGLSAQAEVTNTWRMLLNPSFIERISHVYTSAWITGSFLLLGLGAYYLLKKRHQAFAQESVKIGLILSLLGMSLQFITGHFSALNVFHHQPAKFAALEGHFHSQEQANLYLLGWSDAVHQKTWGLYIPGGLGLLATGNPFHTITGLDAIPKDEQPPINFVFQTYHLMVGIGVCLMALVGCGLWLWWKKSLFQSRIMLRLFVGAAFLPLFANEAGWYTAELGRQPWIVYGLLRTTEGLSRKLQASQVLESILTSLVFDLFLAGVFAFLIVRMVHSDPIRQNGPFKPIGFNYKSIHFQELFSFVRKQADQVTEITVISPHEEILINVMDKFQPAGTQDS